MKIIDKKERKSNVDKRVEAAMNLITGAMIKP